MNNTLKRYNIKNHVGHDGMTCRDVQTQIFSVKKRFYLCPTYIYTFRLILQFSETFKLIITLTRLLVYTIDIMFRQHLKKKNIYAFESEDMISDILKNVFCLLCFACCFLYIFTCFERIQSVMFHKIKELDALLSLIFQLYFNKSYEPVCKNL